MNKKSVCFYVCNPTGINSCSSATWPFTEQHMVHTPRKEAFHWRQQVPVVEIQTKTTSLAQPELLHLKQELKQGNPVASTVYKGEPDTHSSPLHI